MEETKKQKFIDGFTAFAAKFGSEIHLRSLRDAFATLMPLYILAGLAVLLNNTVFTWIFKGATLTSVQYWGTVVINGTLNISGLAIAALIGYHLAVNRDFENPLAAAIVSLATLVVMMPNSSKITTVANKTVEAVGILPFSNIGTGAMFAGIIIGLVATECFIKLSNIDKLKINLGDEIPPAVGESFNVLIPVLIVMSGFGILSALLFNLTGLNLITLITTFIQEPLRHIGTSLPGCLILYALGNLLWFFGIHQSVIYSSILEPLLIINMTQNIATYQAGKAIPNIINVSQIQTFALLGGSGCTLCLLIATFIVSRNKASKSVAKLSVAPGIFNINEPVIFGYPIVYNIAMIIPFILVPTLGIIISYAATAAGIISPCVVQTPWTTPVFLSAFFATAGDWKAVVVQAIILVLGVLIYMPFVKINDRVMAKQAAESTEE